LYDKEKDLVMKEVIGILVLVVASMVVGWRAGSSCTRFQFMTGDYKTFTWSNVSELNAELAKGYIVLDTRAITNNVLKKVSK